MACMREGMLISGSGGWPVSGVRRRPIRQRLGVLLAVSLVAAAAPGVLSASSATPTTSAGGSLGADCVPEIVMLPPPTETSGSDALAMNDDGLVVGTSYDYSGEDFVPPHVVVWQDMEPPIDLGIGGITRSNGSTVHGDAVDVNEAGVVAANRSRLTARGRWRFQTVILWDEDTGKTALPTPVRRPKARVSALNDHGVAVGSAEGPGKRRIPVYWRGGHVKRLPIPEDARYGYAFDLNNRGLIIGSVLIAGQRESWWWRRGGRSGPLPDTDLRTEPSAAAVDDHDRIVGIRSTVAGSLAYLWRGPTAEPRRILGGAGWIATMDNSRHLVGATGGFRGYGDRAWVARLGDDKVTMLPEPPTEGPDGAFANTFGRALGSGVTAFAPQGGLTVAGSAQSEEASRAVLWTCAQTYFE